MRRFYFNVDDEQDTKGAFLNDLGDAKCEAMSLAKQAICDKPNRFRDDSNWKLAVTDTDGEAVFQLQITGTETAGSKDGSTNPKPRSG